MYNLMLNFDYRFKNTKTVHIYMALFALYLSAVLIAVRGTRSMSDNGLELKIWVLTAAFGLMISVLAFFIKRMIDTIEKTTDKLQASLERKTDELAKRQNDQNEHIIRILGLLDTGKEQMNFTKERLSRIESRLDVRKS